MYPLANYLLHWFYFASILILSMQGTLGIFRSQRKDYAHNWYLGCQCLARESEELDKKHGNDCNRVSRELMYY